MSKHSPFKDYINFYHWFKGGPLYQLKSGKLTNRNSKSAEYVKSLPAYGIPTPIRIGNREVESYKKTVDFMPQISHLFMTKTRKELGYVHEPIDELHFIKLTSETITRMNVLGSDKVLRDPYYIADGPLKLSTGLHQLESGTLKLDNESVQLSTEKIDYIKNKWGDTEDIAIFYYYKAEKILLEKHFKHAQLFHSISHSMGVDLHHIDTIIVYSQSFSTSNHTQLRARQCNLKRASTITIHYLLVKHSISEHIFKTVSENKTNYVDTYYKNTFHLKG